MGHEDHELFPGFEVFDIEVEHGVKLHGVVGGGGPPLLLLHGMPQTHAMWHGVASELRHSFTLICPDLRGYGDSSKPLPDSHHHTHAKSRMALDSVSLMSSLGFDSFSVAGHDRGARVLHRLCLNHRDSVIRAAILDASPTITMYGRADKEFATAYYHWFFFLQPRGFPERLISADSDFFIEHHLRGWRGTLDYFHPLALREYLRVMRDPSAVEAMCEDYRAGGSIDLVEDQAAMAAGQLITAPLLVLWGTEGSLARLFDPLDDWRRVTAPSLVTGQALPAGHALAEERPYETARQLKEFLSKP